jgi:Plasmid pRiA4b ORF-3-like protein
LGTLHEILPPEDRGGIWGYRGLIEVLADPRHEEHQERLEWLGLDSPDQFDPAAFDPAQANAALAAMPLKYCLSPRTAAKIHASPCLITNASER